MFSVVAMIVTYNPDMDRFKKVLGSLNGEIDRIAIIDNNSQNISTIEESCKNITSCDVVKLQFNSGVAYALMYGIRYIAKKYNPGWFLLLDDDTIMVKGAVRVILKILEAMPKEIREEVGLIKLGSNKGNCKVYNVPYAEFSGSLVKSNVALRTCCRSDFFLDQADHDLYFRVRKLGYLTLRLNCKLIDHKLGIKIFIPLLKREVNYEPPWRYYYVTRNSTILLREGALDAAFYLWQLIALGLPILLQDGIRKFLKPLGLGLIHALLNQLGYLDRKYFS